MFKAIWAAVICGNPASWAILALGAIVALGAASGVGAYVMHKMDKADYVALQLADAKAQIAAVQTAQKLQAQQDAVKNKDSVAEAKAQQKLDDQRNLIPQRVVLHVKDTLVCVPYGVIRMFNGYAHGLSDADITIAAGKSDDSCSEISWRSLTNDITDDYAIGIKNAEQLDALEADVQRLVIAGQKVQPAAATAK